MVKKRRHAAYVSLRAWREAHQLSQRQAAQQFGITQGAWCKLEMGHRHARRDLLQRLRNATRVPLEVLTGIAS